MESTSCFYYYIAIHFLPNYTPINFNKILSKLLKRFWYFFPLFIAKVPQFCMIYPVLNKLWFFFFFFYLKLIDYNFKIIVSAFQYESPRFILNRTRLVALFCQEIRYVSSKIIIFISMLDTYFLVLVLCRIFSLLGKHCFLVSEIERC